MRTRLRRGVDASGMLSGYPMQPRGQDGHDDGEKAWGLDARWLGATSLTTPGRVCEHALLGVSNIS